MRTPWNQTRSQSRSRVVKAMILAAGRGERMRPLTDTCPKPLLAAGGKPLLAWHLERLAEAGYQEVVINHAHLGFMLQDALGDGHAFGLSIIWSDETQGVLETAGGIVKALPHLGTGPFLVINGDIFCDWDVSRAKEIASRMKATHDLGHLVMVPNPPQHKDGDFILEGGRIVNMGSNVPMANTADREAKRLTFSGIGIYDPNLFAGISPGTSAKLAPLLKTAIAQSRLGGEAYRGRWHDIGTPERLAALDRELHDELRRDLRHELRPPAADV